MHGQQNIKKKKKITDNKKLLVLWVPFSKDSGQCLFTLNNYAFYPQSAFTCFMTYNKQQLFC